SAATTLVIGETQGRVNEYAAEHGFVTWSGFNASDFLGSLERNALLIHGAIDAGWKIVNHGLDPSTGQEGGRPTHGWNYTLERLIMWQRDYRNYVDDFDDTPDCPSEP